MRSPEPEAYVIVPARDEAVRIERCLTALADQAPGVPFEVILVLDGCVDSTGERARELAGARRELRLTVLELGGEGVGAARRLGMDLACRRLRTAGLDRGLITTTDADSVVAVGWLAAQLAAVAAGAEAVGGRIELDVAEARELAPGVAARRRASQAQRLAEVRTREPDAEHWQFSGASMGVTAQTYARVGGLEPLRALEDEAFERRLRAHGIPIVRTEAVRVATSARTQGRAPAGLARDLARWTADAPGAHGFANATRVGMSVVMETPEHTEEGYPEEQPAEVVPDEQANHGGKRRGDDDPSDADRAPDTDDGQATGNPA